MDYTRKIWTDGDCNKQLDLWKCTTQYRFSLPYSSLQVFGAVIDYTDHRKLMGILSAALLTTIQGIQIGTVEVSRFKRQIFNSHL